MKMVERGRHVRLALAVQQRLAIRPRAAVVLRRAK
jgi:hypothetical protein